MADRVIRLECRQGGSTDSRSIALVESCRLVLLPGSECHALIRFQHGFQTEEIYVAGKVWLSVAALKKFWQTD